MAVNEDVTSYNTTAASNTPAGTDVIGSDLDDHLRDMKKNIKTVLNLVQANVGAVGGVQGLSFTAVDTSRVTLGFTPGSCVDTSATTVITYDHAGVDTRLMTAGAWAGATLGNIMETAAGRVANTGYYIWAIKDTVNDTADLLASTSGSVSNLIPPTGWTAGFKAQLLWWVRTNAAGGIFDFVQAKNGTRCSFRSEITATAGSAAGVGKQFQTLEIPAPNYADVKVQMHLQEINPVVGRMGLWLADGSSTYTAATTINATSLVDISGSEVVSLGVATSWVMTDGASNIRYAYTEATSASVTIKVLGFVLYRRGNAQPQ